MAWPITPLTTYVAGGLPWISASDLNAIQDAINRIINGTYSHKAVVVDGTGGIVTAGTPGTVRVSSTVSAYTTTPPFAMPSVPVGELNSEQVLLGAARCSLSGGAIVACGGFNVREAERVAIGAFLVTFNTAFPDVLRHVPLVSPSAGSGPSRYAALASIGIVSGGYRVGFRVYDSSGSQADPIGFSVVVFGG